MRRLRNVKQNGKENLMFFLNDNIWHTGYKMCFKTIYDNSVIWFQWKIILGILVTKDFMFKMKIVESNPCSLCGEKG